ncbi:MAG TPA: carbon storage regulator CsrA [Armatimonadota bacterium]|jgi:carbon storage regulator
MLVLTRRAGQSIQIGEDVEITVVEVRGDQVRLGINAPRNVSILRKEILEEIHAETRQAAEADADVLAELSGIAGETPGP